MAEQLKRASRFYDTRVMEDQVHQGKKTKSNYGHLQTSVSYDPEDHTPIPLCQLREPKHWYNLGDTFSADLGSSV